MTIIRMKKIRFFGKHGVSISEKKRGGTFEIDLEFHSDVDKSHLTDDLNHTIDYSKIYKKVYDSFYSSDYNLIETLGNKICDDLISSFPIKEIKLIIRKINPPVNGLIDSVEIEINKWNKIKILKNNVYLSLGSNIGNSINILNSAIDHLNLNKNCKVNKISSFYDSEPIGFINQKNFVNCVIKIATNLSPIKLLDLLKIIELNHGRKKNKKKNMPRILDIDIIFFNNLIMNSKNLIIPHPEYFKRRFVLEPLLEISSQKKCPNHGIPLINKLNKCKNQKITIINSWIIYII